MMVSRRLLDKFLQNPAQVPLSPPLISRKFTQIDTERPFRSDISAPKLLLYGTAYLVIKLICFIFVFVALDGTKVGSTNVIYLV
jgi:hypothetical protein